MSLYCKLSRKPILFLSVTGMKALLQESPLSYYSPLVHRSPSGNHTLEAE
jgi:hypothetical protein